MKKKTLFFMIFLYADFKTNMSENLEVSIFTNKMDFDGKYLR
jgi:hypothetical protein